MNEKAPERIWLEQHAGKWLVWLDGQERGVEYIRSDLLATARKEAREAVFREAAEKVHAISRIDAKDKSRDFLSGAAWLQNKAALMLATLSVEAATTDTEE